jgi:hypothetical protein
MKPRRIQWEKEFHRCARERLEEAKVLLQHRYPTGAVYLAGYAVECGLKALILNRVPRAKHEEIVANFRGARSHDFEWLRRFYRRLGAPMFPQEVNAMFLIVDDWSTNLRYSATRVSTVDCRRFVAATRELLQFFGGRL